ncbi:exodeoxyribonuclease VII large subunit [Frigidibacter sp. RF13]|uniref:exodeoxyribonuclease VII large subunit n=1 Tax=Frigidibacter sp. RF13 TaxID=2997340 RepID=UPI00226F6505|nr:exodeoxyribonuclease VII large subunit [Frigidibacter sp. RF13]MCY1126942.1 exodeoxyribonuclease VII large subunit [Frigidibacter sp. RF13]
MMDIFEDASPGPGNSPEFTVSEISGAVKRVIEGEFGHVRVRGEISRVSRPASGHLYFDLKDDRAVIAAVSWKGQAARMSVRPEEGMEVIATGRLTTFPGQSKYQLIVDDIVPAGAGALMVMLEKLKARLSAEGLFAQERKKPIPYLPEVIGVVTSPSGAVIRDILHRLRDRFPRRVLIWPVAVQGEKCAPEVAAAIRGFNALTTGGPIPRPDLLIVARGGGSIEDLWGFNDEQVVRAAADSAIPLISAVGHETDTTLIDHAADRRAPTPTAAAEMAVPVRMELLAWTQEQSARLARATRQRLDQRRQRLADLSRALGRPEALTGNARQRLDLWSDRLPGALRQAALAKRTALTRVSARVQPPLLTRVIEAERRHLGQLSARLAPALRRRLEDETKDARQRRADLARLGQALDRAVSARLAALLDRLASLDRTRQTLGYRETLKRGFAVVRADDRIVTSRAAAERATLLEIEFQDGRLTTGGRLKIPTKKPPGPDQGSLF